MKEFVAKTKMCPIMSKRIPLETVVLGADVTVGMEVSCKGSECMMWEWHDKSPITRGDPNSTAGETIEYEQVEGDCGLKK